MRSKKKHPYPPTPPTKKKIQLARAMGASEVVGVCSGKNASIVKSHGAHRTIDYKTQQLDALGQSTDGVPLDEGAGAAAAASNRELDVLESIVDVFNSTLRPGEAGAAAFDPLNASFDSALDSNVCRNPFSASPLRRAGALLEEDSDDTPFEPGAPGEYDLVYDTASGSNGTEDYVTAARRVLRKATETQPAGQYVALNGTLTKWLRMFVGLQQKNTHLFLTTVDRNGLAAVAAMAARAKTLHADRGGNPREQVAGVFPAICQTVPFTASTVRRCVQKLKGRHTVGKIVFDMDIATMDTPGSSVASSPAGSGVRTPFLAAGVRRRLRPPPSPVQGMPEDETYSSNHPARDPLTPSRLTLCVDKLYTPSRLQTHKETINMTFMDSNVELWNTDGEANTSGKESDGEGNGSNGETDSDQDSVVSFLRNEKMVQAVAVTEGVAAPMPKVNDSAADDANVPSLVDDHEQQTQLLNSLQQRLRAAAESPGGEKMAAEIDGGVLGISIGDANASDNVQHAAGRTQQQAIKPPSPPSLSSSPSPPSPPSPPRQITGIANADGGAKPLSPYASLPASLKVAANVPMATSSPAVPPTPTLVGKTKKTASLQGSQPPKLAKAERKIVAAHEPYDKISKATTARVAKARAAAHAKAEILRTHAKGKRAAATNKVASESKKESQKKMKPRRGSNGNVDRSCEDRRGKSVKTSGDTSSRLGSVGSFLRKEEALCASVKADGNATPPTASPFPSNVWLGSADVDSICIAPNAHPSRTARDSTAIQFKLAKLEAAGKLTKVHLDTGDDAFETARDDAGPADGVAGPIHSKSEAVGKSRKVWSARDAEARAAANSKAANLRAEAKAKRAIAGGKKLETESKRESRKAIPDASVSDSASKHTGTTARRAKTAVKSRQPHAHARSPGTRLAQSGPMLHTPQADLRVITKEVGSNIKGEPHAEQKADASLQAELDKHIQATSFLKAQLEAERRASENRAAEAVALMTRRAKSAPPARSNQSASPRTSSRSSLPIPKRSGSALSSMSRHGVAQRDSRVIPAGPAPSQIGPQNGSSSVRTSQVATEPKCDSPPKAGVMTSLRDLLKRSPSHFDAQKHLKEDKLTNKTSDVVSGWFKWGRDVAAAQPRERPFGGEVGARHLIVSPDSCYSPSRNTISEAPDSPKSVKSTTSI